MSSLSARSSSSLLVGPSTLAIANSSLCAVFPGFAVFFSQYQVALLVCTGVTELLLLMLVNLRPPCQNVAAVNRLKAMGRPALCASQLSVTAFATPCAGYVFGVWSIICSLYAASLDNPQSELIRHSLASVDKLLGLFQSEQTIGVQQHCSLLVSASSCLATSRVNCESLLKEWIGGVAKHVCECVAGAGSVLSARRRFVHVFSLPSIACLSRYYSKYGPAYRAHSGPAVVQSDTKHDAESEKQAATEAQAAIEAEG